MLPRTPQQPQIHWRKPSGYAASHCMNCKAGWTRTGKDGGVLIRLRVTGDRDRTVQFVRNLERSQRFLAPRLAGESSLTAEKAKALGQPVPAGAGRMNVNEPIGNGVEFEIFSGYNPLPEGPGPRDQGSGKTEQEQAAEPAVRHNRKASAR